MFQVSVFSAIGSDRIKRGNTLAHHTVNLPFQNSRRLLRFTFGGGSIQYLFRSVCSHQGAVLSSGRWGGGGAEGEKRERGGHFGFGSHEWGKGRNVNLSVRCVLEIRQEVKAEDPDLRLIAGCMFGRGGAACSGTRPTHWRSFAYPADSSTSGE